MGVEAFQQRLALPLQLYSPYLCSRTPYAKSFDLIRSNPKLEGCAGFDFQQPRPSEASRFYSFLFGIGSQFGMVNYEIDFVNQNLQCVNEYFQNHSSASMFLDGKYAMDTLLHYSTQLFGQRVAKSVNTSCHNLTDVGATYS